MKRLHAILIFTYLAACVCVMLGKEAWRYVMRERKHDQHKGARRKARSRAA